MATTTNYSFDKPTVGGNEDTWGTLLNGNWDALDALLGGVSSTEFAILDGATVTTDELNILDGVTATTAELNILNGVTATTAELNYVSGVTGAIQAQLDAKYETETQDQADWEAGTETTESLVSPAKIKAAIDAISVGGKPTALIIDKLASPTDVALTAATWNTAYLTVTSIDAGYTLSSNAVTVPAGTYYAEFSIPVACNKSDKINAAVVRLRNVTAGTTAVLGQSAAIGDWQCLNMHGAGQFTVASSSALSLEIWVNESSAYQRRFTDASDASGEEQIFAMLKLWEL